MVLLPDATHDDGLFMALGRSLAEGHWLGDFNQFTLMKGPGFPAFVNNWLGIPIPSVMLCFTVSQSHFS
jgi:hypothetical protein